MKQNNVIVDKSKAFAIRIINMHKYFKQGEERIYFIKANHAEWYKYRSQCKGGFSRI